MRHTAEIEQPVQRGLATAAFVRLCAIAFLAYCSYAMCRTPILPLLASDLGASPPLVGLVVGASTITGIILKLPAGAWSDVLGRRPLLISGCLVFAVMPFTYLAAASLASLIALRFVHGSATAIFGPVAAASLSDIAPTSRRATWLGSYATIQGAGQALGPVVAGYAIASGRYDIAFLVAGLLALATPLIAAGWPRRGVAVRHAPLRPPLRQLASGLMEVGRDRLILVTSLAQAAQFVLHGTLNAFLPLFARDVLGATAAEIGWLFALQVSTTLLARPVMGMVSDRVGRRTNIVVGLATCAMSVMAVSVATTMPILAIAIVAYAFGVAVTTASTSAFITDLSRRSLYGTAHGVFGTIYDVGDALGPIVAGLLVSTAGYGATFRIMAGVALVGAGVFAVTSRRALARSGESLR